MSKTVLAWVTAAALAFGLSAVAGASYTAAPPEPGPLPTVVPARVCRRLDRQHHRRVPAGAAVKALFHIFAWSGVCAIGLAAASLMAGLPT